MFKSKGFFISKVAILTFMLLFFISACAPQATNSTPIPESQQLRITNSGSTDIVGLEVLFPGPRWDAPAYRVKFGNIPAGQTTEYQNVLSGVYRYAAYSYTLDSGIVTQPVLDWVGESPMAGKKFTYQIALDLNKVQGAQMSLITVLVDVP